MKNKIIKIVAIGLCIFASQSYALDGSGKIEEFKICGAGGSWSTWNNYLLFKLSDGNWFGAYGNHGKYDADDSITHSAVMMVIANKWEVSVRATAGAKTVCGVTAHFIYNRVGDYFYVQDFNN